MSRSFADRMVACACRDIHKLKFDALLQETQQVCFSYGIVVFTPGNTQVIQSLHPPRCATGILCLPQAPPLWSSRQRIYPPAYGSI